MSVVPARPVDFLRAAAQTAGWSGEENQALRALPGLQPHLSAADYAEALRNLGLNVEAVIRRLSDLEVERFPILFQAADGSVRLAEREDDAIWSRSEGAPAGRTDPVPSLSVLLIQPSPAETEAESPAGAKPGVARLLGRHKKSIATIVALTALINLLGLLPPLLVMAVYDTVVPTASVPLLWSLVLLALGLIVLDILLRLVRAWTIGLAGARLERALSRAVFEKYTRLPVPAVTRLPVFKHIQRLRQFDGLRDTLTGTLALNLLDLPFALIFLVTIWIFSPPVAAVLVLTLALFAVLGVVATRAQNKAGAAASTARADLEAVQHELAKHRRTLRHIGATETFLNQTNRLTEVAEAATLAQKRVQNRVQTLGTALAALAGLATVALATLQSIAGAMSFGGLIVVLTLVWRILGPVQMLFASWPRVLGLAASIRQIDGVLSQEEERYRAGLSGRIKTLAPPLALQNVFLRFDRVSDPALANVSLTIAPGELIAITGASGAGKSCLLHVLAKLYTPGSGAVLIGDVDYRQLAVDDIRHALSFAHAETALFDLTLRDNLKLGNPSLSDAEILSLFETLGAGRELRRCRQGLDTPIDETFRRHVSTAQARTFALVRALGRPAAIYLLDDAMSGLPPSRARALWQYLDGMRGAKTTLIVTNRPEHLSRADRVLYIEAGRIALDLPGAEGADAVIERMSRPGGRAAA
ncbi:MAG: ABC transporter transmembrane domain-containing protein [Pseudomonadota bacterium]